MMPEIACTECGKTGVRTYGGLCRECHEAIYGGSVFG